MALINVAYDSNAVGISFLYKFLSSIIDAENIIVCYILL